MDSRTRAALNTKNTVPPAPPQNVPTALTEVEYLRQIADHLKSIRAMLTFFTVVLVVAIILQFFQ